MRGVLASSPRYDTEHRWALWALGHARMGDRVLFAASSLDEARLWIGRIQQASPDPADEWNVIPAKSRLVHRSGGVVDVMVFRDRDDLDALHGRSWTTALGPLAHLPKIIERIGPAGERLAREELAAEQARAAPEPEAIPEPAPRED